MRHTPLNIGPIHHHPAAGSLIHRPIPGHVKHQSGAPPAVRPAGHHPVTAHRNFLRTPR
jgi:hypothetical protein